MKHSDGWVPILFLFSFANAEKVKEKQKLSKCK